MPRPFRHQAPDLPERAVERRALLDRLAERWERRLVTIVAGPGFGKTVLLVAAMADNTRDPVGRDVWLSCEAADESAEHLATGIAEALGLAPDAGVEAILDAVWASAPGQVCLVLDDVHEVPPGSDGASLLDRLVRDLPGNGHLVLASRDAVPVRTARLAAAGGLARVSERDLVLARAELEAFAFARGVEPGLLASTGGWPALAELTATAGEDLVLDYLWEEVLARLGAERSRLLARLAVVGGGDDEVASAIAGRAAQVGDLVASIPLVERSAAGWASLHPLWRPALRGLLTSSEAADARRAAAAVHCRRGRLTTAVELLAEGEAWRELLGVFREAEMHLVAPVTAAELGRWCRLLPPAWRTEPEALLAAGVELQARSPGEAVALFESARGEFRARNDVDGEIAAIAQEGLVRWWANDLDELLGLIERAGALGDAGASLGRALAAIGAAGAAHLAGESAQVFSELDGIGDELPAGWAAVVRWLRSVAHRRDGHLDAARRELDVGAALAAGRFAPTIENARLHVAWLEGRVDEGRAGLSDHRARREQTGDRYLEREAALELAFRSAWLGQPGAARELLARADALAPEDEVPGMLVRILRDVAEGAIAVSEGDEARAAAGLREGAVETVGGPGSWYWRDRAAIALAYVLVPETRATWSREPLGPAHVPGLRLAEALAAVRDGDLAGAASLEWPEAGVVRAHLPLRWAVELAAAAAAAGNPAPEGLARALGSQLRQVLQSIAATTGVAPVAATASRWAAELPAVPPYHLRIDVIGPIEMHRDGQADTAPELRRQRVRELLCYMVAHRRARREAVAADLWPELDDSGRNLRVTLSYLQRALQPDRAGDDPPYFLRSDGTWLELTGADRLEVDVWRLEELLDAAAAAERDGAPGTALAAYQAALPLWRGEPYAEAPGAPWAQAGQAALRNRYLAAAVRAGELLLARGDGAGARDAAARAVSADPWAEAAYRLLARGHLADGDRGGARRAVDACRAALAELDLAPEPATLALLPRQEQRQP